MAKPLDIESYHKYLGFLASEIAQAIKAGADDDAVVRLSAEFNAFKQRCSASDLPESIRMDIAKTELNYTSAAVERSNWMILAGVLSLGSIVGVLYYVRTNKRKTLLRDLKTELEALSMRSKLQYL